jgi:hypothetical protein
MRGMKREIGAKKKKRLVAVIVIALILAVISFLVAKAGIPKFKGLIFFSVFILISGIGVYTVSKQPDDDRY